MLSFSGRSLPKVNALWRVSFGPSWRQRRRSISDYEIIFVEEGSIRFYIEGRPLDAEPGDALLFLPGRQHWSDAPGGGGVSWSFVHFLVEGKALELDEDLGPEALAKRLKGKAVKRGGSLYRTPPCGELEEIVLPEKTKAQELREEIAGLFRKGLLERPLPWPDSPQRLSLISLEIMILLTRLALRKNVPELAPEREEEASLLTEAVRRLNAGLGGNIELEPFCKGLGCSPQKLRRLFAEAFAEPPGQYLQKLRLAEAKRLLAETGFTAKEICGLVGFADPNYFSRLFRQKEGMSPLAYREEARRRR